MNNGSRFWDGIADKYSKIPLADPAAYERKLEVTRAYMTAEMEVLEIGCGTGSTAIYHAPAVKHIRAIDISPAMLEIAKAKAIAAEVTNVTFQVAAIEDLALVGSSVDMVMAHSILHLVPDCDAVIGKIARALKPEGVFVSSTVCLGEKPLMRAFIAVAAPVGRMLGKFPPVLRALSEKQLATKIVAAGFAIEEQWRATNGQVLFVVARKT
ncbi:MAG: class I SAM-dependent methyltransferase [Proteobacteria bacterium]|nr:class I SAM-dependent methyltransferase [Pseudomonadota bacterium]MDA1059839.1 class I SAM-dependent methyltransferase [Pseudomonadota bacterium]